MPLGDLAYRLRILNDDGSDYLVISSLAADDHPYIAEPPRGDGSTLDPVTGQVSLGAYTVQVIDAEGTVQLAGQGWLDDPEVDDNGEPTGGFDAEWPLTRTVDGTPTPGVGELEMGGAILTMTVPQNAGIGLIGTAVLSRTRTFTGFNPGSTYTVKIQTTLLGSIGANALCTVTANGASQGLTPGPNTITLSAIADGSGNIAITYGIVVNGPGQPAMVATFGYPTFSGPTAGGGTPLPDPDTVSGRVVTISLADLTGRQHLLSRKGLVEESTNLGGDWTVLTAGYVNRYAFVDALKVEFTIGESRRVEQSKKLFERTTDPERFPDLIGKMDRASCLIGGPIIGDFGPTQDRGRPLFEVTDVTGTRVRLRWVSGFLYHGMFHEGDPPIDDANARWINRGALDYLPGAGAEESTAFQTQPLPNVVCRLYDATDGSFIADQVVLAHTVNEFVFGLYLFIDSDGTFYVEWTGTLPSVGARYKLAVFPTAISERNPLHISGHPVDILSWWLPLGAVEYDAASLEDMRAYIGPEFLLELRLTTAMTVQEACEQYIYGPFGIAPRMSDDGELEFFASRDGGAASVGHLTNDDLSSDAGTCFVNEEANAANAVLFTCESYSLVDVDERTDETPFDGFRVAKIRIPVDAEDADGNAVFGEREIKWEIPGQIAGLSTGTSAEPGTLDLWVAGQAQPVFDWQGRGSVEGEFHVLRGNTTAKIGDMVTHLFAHVPTSSPAQLPTSQRGTVTHKAIVLRRTESPEGPTLLLQDRGPTDAPVRPPFVFPNLCDDIDPPQGLVATVDGTTVTLTWTNTTDATPLELRYAETGDTDPIAILTLPAGSVTLTVTMPDESTAYTFSLRYRNAPPGTCASDYATVDATTGVMDTLDPPIEPAAFSDGAGTYGMECTATEIPSGTEVWEAVETDVESGTPGTFSLGGSVVSVADGRTRYTSAALAANDGLLRYLKARHTRSGWEPSDYCGTVSVYPWVDTPPDPPPGEPPDEDPPGSAVTDVPVPIVFVSAPERQWDNLPAAVDELGPEEVAPLGPFGSCFLVVRGDVCTVPTGTKLAVQYQKDDLSWDFLAGQQFGPYLWIDAATVADWPGGFVVGVTVPIAEDARRLRKLRLVSVDGDGTGTLVPGRVTLWLYGVPLNPEPPEQPEGENPLIEVPCDTGSFDASDFTSIEEFLAIWSLELSGNISGQVTLDVDPDDLVTPVIKLDVFCGASNPAGAVARLTRTVEGLDQKATFATAELEAKLVTNSFGIEDTGFGFTGTGTSLWGIGPTGTGNFLNPPAYDTFTLSPAATLPSHTITIGTNGAQNGDQFHNYIAYITRVTVTLDEDCTEFIPDPDAELPPGCIPDQPGHEEAPPPVGSTPPMPPITGDAPFMIMDANLDVVPGPWNGGLIKHIKPGTAAIAAIEAARDAGQKHMWMPQGTQGYWMVGGQFNLNMWIAAVRRWSGLSYITDAQDDQTLWANYLFDEPNLVSRYGRRLSVAELTTMAAVSRELWPDWPVFLRCTPGQYNTVIPGVTGYFAMYTLRKGPVDRFLATNIADSQRLGAQLIVGLNVTHYDGSGSAPITPDQMRRDGTPLARSSYPCAFAMWKHDLAWEAQPGVLPAAQELGTLFEASRP